MDPEKKARTEKKSNSSNKRAIGGLDSFPITATGMTMWPKDPRIMVTIDISIVAIAGKFNKIQANNRYSFRKMRYCDTVGI